ncbi:MAG: NAD-dependent malic enzyme [Pseudomonadales bacterium]|nr:NAD-dependent malic enzyme [Pseudomonadales bacterium]
MKKKGFELINNFRLTKGTAFTLEERDEYGLTGLLPPRVSTLEQQVEWVLANLRRKPDPIDKYRYLASLQKRNERLFYRLLIDHIEELMPIIYTPTVGQACQEFAYIYRQTSGFYISIDHRGRIHDILDNWPEEDVRLIVVTDGERILGLGDLGVSGMGIPIGKLALYCACAGIHPEHCLPIMLDVGTDNDHFRNDPLYQGKRERRVRGTEYDEFMAEFVAAVKSRFPQALLQFEDFATPNAVSLLERYHDELLCFNDDIQGTAAVALAGLYAATRITGQPLHEMRFMFMGAGSAATGIGRLLSIALQREGLSQAQANARCVFIDSKGLITRSRESLTSHAAAFASELEPMSMLEAIDVFRPQALIGATGRPGGFTHEVIGAMARLNPHPIIFALSNPTANAECTAEDAYEYSEGRAIFASGSPFGVVNINGEIRVPGQGNNAYVFPGLGLGVLHSGASRITDDLLIAAAQALAMSVAQTQITHGCLYPPLNQIRQVSLEIAFAVATMAAQTGLTDKVIDAAFRADMMASMYEPRY